MRMLNVVISLFLTIGVSNHLSHDLAALADPATTSEAASRLINLSRSDSSVRSNLAGSLPAMLLQTRNMDVVRSEAKLAGALRIETAIPSLIRLLSGPNYEGAGSLSTRRELENDPVARALFDIGKPALPALKEALKSNDRETRGRAAGILVLTNTPETQAILRDHIAVEPDGGLRAYIRGNLTGSAR